MATTSTASTAAQEISSLAKACNPFNYGVTPADRELFDRELRSFVPPDTFDAHLHWFNLSHLSPGTPPDALKPRLDIGYDAMIAHTEQWMGDRTPRAGLAFPFPGKFIDSVQSNAFLVNELAHHPDSRGLMMVSPKDDPAYVEDFIKRNPCIVGLKVYHVYADRPDTMNAEQGEFLPEWAWEIADRRSLWITMHLVLNRALADARNQRYIREHCLRYPGAKYVLAHAARGFSASHTIEGISSLRRLDNVFFDTSAVCEAGAFEAILREFGTTRLMYGSDFPISAMRGRSISAGDGFFWLFDHNTQWDGWTLGGHTLVGIESLFALRQASRTMHLTSGDLERLFSTNARRLLNITPAPTGAKVQAQYRQAKTLIPGGTQLLSKRPEMFAPEQWPAYYEQAIGCEVVDTDGRKFIDMSSGGILACILGYADPDVNAAVIRRVNLGTMSTLQTADEIEVARLLTQIHPWAHMARFTRSGGEAMAVAVRIARAATGRDKVTICGYHGWHDWYLSANLGGVDDAGKRTLDGHLLPGLEPRGVPRSLAGTAVTFRYNQLAELDQIIAKQGKEIAAIVMETTRQAEPEPGFLEGVRQRADRIGAKLLFDEISIGWRLCLGGAHLKYGVNPDLAVYAKTISNGFAMGAVIGTRETMQAAQESFISSAYWTEGVGPAAAVAAIKKMMQIDVPSHLRQIGGAVLAGWEEAGKRHRLPVKVGSRSELTAFSFDLPAPDAAAAATFFTVRMLRRGFLASTYFNPMLAHEMRHAQAYLAAVNEVFGELAKALADGCVKEQIGGPVKHSGFARLT
ncbi:MAG: aminotransferase class III-fold pyridoxal phosphate-dependent enzyme [Phycisphaeraceae bacterium]|nr:aminotransferase class III-fold pyridoxal phosphate-dependent enzyme [Phycisphaeraceae bacterium]